jgi:hypothetical protein
VGRLTNNQEIIKLHDHSYQTGISNRSPIIFKITIKKSFLLNGKK